MSSLRPIMISNRKNKNAFTLLELVVVIIIVGVLASLAMTRFLKLIEFSRSSEALANIAALRQAVERCYLMQNGGSYIPNCQLNAGGPTNLDIEDPTNSPGAHFRYIINDMTGVKYMITAYRTTFDVPSGSVVNQCTYVRLSLKNDDTITREGFNVCAGIK